MPSEIIIGEYREADLYLLYQMIIGALAGRPKGLKSRNDRNRIAVLWDALYVDETALFNSEEFKQNLISHGECAFLDGNFIPIVKILDMPLVEMSIFINHAHAAVALMAQWRLQIAK